MTYQDFSFYWKIISSPHAVKILFLSFTCEDIGVTMATNAISHLQESFPLRRAAGSFEISFTRSCLLCRNFISIYKINRKLHSRLVIRPLSSRAESIFNSYIHYSILSCFILIVYYQKDSRPRRIFLFQKYSAL